jgi:ATP-dependent helicase IRC3
MPELRSYQSDDVAAVIAAHAEHRCVLGRAPTGSGKAVALAAIAQHYAQFGKVMVLVDVGKLVHQLAETVEWFTGQLPGVEMADRTVLADWFDPPRIIVGTVQTQYSGPPGRERYRRFDPSEYSALLLDECELFLAPKAREVVDWYVASNPSIRVFGCSATPFRTDGIAMAELFDHVAFDRDIRWGVDDGWLVRPLQGFVRVSLDFSTLKIRTNDYGERDYSDAEIAERINNERTLIELAQGIIHAAGDRRSIIACPDVESAKAVAHYLRRRAPRLLPVRLRRDERRRQRRGDERTPPGRISILVVGPDADQGLRRSWRVRRLQLPQDPEQAAISAAHGPMHAARAFAGVSARRDP